MDGPAFYDDAQVFANYARLRAHPARGAVLSLPETETRTPWPRRLPAVTS